MDHHQFVDRVYAAFNARDLDGLLTRMIEDVEWPNAWEGGRLRGRLEVREYWTRQWAQIDPRVEPRAVRLRPDGRLEVAVHQVVRSLAGEVLDEGMVLHVYTLDDGLVARMDVESA